MAVTPFRLLGALGVNTDSDPYSFQDPRQWTTAINVRFRDGAVWRGPRFRKAGTVAGNDPQSVIGYGLPDGGYEYLVTFRDGRIVRWSQRGNLGEPGLQRDMTPAYWNGHNYIEPGTWAETNAVVYFNRPDRVLWSMRKGGKVFAKVEGWGKAWRCKSVRALNGQVIAIGVQKDGRDYPTMVLNSDYTTYATSADTWNADTTNSASSNVLADLPSGLVDGWPMQDRMFLYGAKSTWVMEPSYDNFVFRYRRVFEADSGVISQNCVIDVTSSHYVFGPETIWMHNGLSRQDLVDGVVRRDIYDHIVAAESHKFFVVYIAERNEIMFCHVSTHPDCKFKLSTDADVPAPGCNRAAVLNLKEMKWSFDDLPFVLGAAIVSAHTGKRWEEFGPDETWDKDIHTWNYYADRTRPTPLFIARALVPPVNNPIKANDDAFTVGASILAVDNVVTLSSQGAPQYYIRGSVLIARHQNFDTIAGLEAGPINVFGQTVGSYTPGELRQDMEIFYAGVTRVFPDTTQEFCDANGKLILDLTPGYVTLFRDTPFTPSELASLPPAIFGTSATREASPHGGPTLITEAELLGNDTGSGIRLVNYTNAEHGTVAPSRKEGEDGIMYYRPNTPVLQDRFSYTIDDSQGNTSTATVTINLIQSPQ